MRRLALVFALLSCAGPVAEVRPDPAEGRAAWIAALQSGDSGRVWALLAEDTRRQFESRAAFDGWIGRHAADLLIDALAMTGPPEEVVRLSGGLEVVRAEGGWRVRRSVLDGPSGTPIEALRRLREVVRTVSGDGRDLWADATASGLAKLGELLDASIARGDVKAADRVRVDLGQGADVTLVKERGGFLVEGVTFPHP